jgi:hypothetical protein
MCAEGRGGAHASLRRCEGSCGCSTGSTVRGRDVGGAGCPRREGMGWERVSGLGRPLASRSAASMRAMERRCVGVPSGRAPPPGRSDGRTIALSLAAAAGANFWCLRCRCNRTGGPVSSPSSGFPIGGGGDEGGPGFR